VGHPAVYAPALKGYFPGIRADQASDEVEKSGLAGAVGADEPGDLQPGEAEGATGHGLGSPE